MLKVVDLSSNNGTSHVEAGQDLTILKATEGTGYINPLITQADGYYHYLDDASNAYNEGVHFGMTISGFAPKGKALILDYETSTPDQGAVRQFRSGLESIVSNSNLWLYAGQAGGDVAAQLNMPFWFAMYPYESTSDSPATWDAPMEYMNNYNFNVSMWQFTTSGDVLDRSLFFGEVNQWNALTCKGGDDTPPTGSVAVDGHKTLIQMATDATIGFYGNGDDRKTALGDLYNPVQDIVDNENGGLSTEDLNHNLATYVIEGLLGNGDERQTLLGEYYNDVMDIVNQRLGNS